MFLETRKKELSALFNRTKNILDNLIKNGFRILSFNLNHMQLYKFLLIFFEITNKKCELLYIFGN